MQKELPMRIDAHVHYMPPTIDPAQLAGREPYWGLLLGPKSVQGWASAEQMIAAMDRAGLARVALVGEYFRRHEACVERNNRAMELARRWPNRIIPLAVIQPNAGPLALAELRRCLDAGFAGVGELNPYAQGFSLSDTHFLRLAEACIRHNIPLNLHVNEAVGPYYPGKSTTPLRHYYRLAQTLPELKLILAHWGGGLLFYELMPKVGRVLKNVWYDTAASPLLYPTAKIFATALHCVDSGKILYGSDYPLRLYPRRQTAPDFSPFIEEIEQLKLPPDAADNIMGLNAARLFGLLPAGDQPPAPSAPPTSLPLPLDGSQPVALVAEAWPATRPVFEAAGIAWQDTPVPHWEPVLQAAAAGGLSPQAQQKLIETLNRVISDNPG